LSFKKNPLFKKIVTHSVAYINIDFTFDTYLRANMTVTNNAERFTADFVTTFCALIGVENYEYSENCSRGCAL